MTWDNVFVFSAALTATLNGACAGIDASNRRFGGAVFYAAIALMWCALAAS